MIHGRAFSAEVFRRGVSSIRWLGFRVLRGALILRYHRVADLSTDPLGNTVKPEHFQQHLKILRANKYQPMRLLALTRSLRDGGLPRRGVVVTLDDGYADTLDNAKPLLEDYDIPATAFIATGYVGANREFWWDELEQLIFVPAVLPPALRLVVGGEEYGFRVAVDTGWDVPVRTRQKGYGSQSLSDPSHRHRLYRELLGVLRRLGEGERRAALVEIANWAGQSPQVRPSHAILDADGVRALAEGGLVEIGAHTVTHADLSLLDPSARRREIVDCKDSLERLLGHPISSFAYPFGRASGSAKAVREAGFEAACGTRANVVFRGADPYRLPRLYVGDWDAQEFERRLPTLVH